MVSLLPVYVEFSNLDQLAVGPISSPVIKFENLEIRDIKYHQISSNIKYKLESLTWTCNNDVIIN